MDAAVVPALLLLIARDLLLHDPLRILAWRLLHEPRLQDLPTWLRPFLPETTAGFDQDPIALVLASMAAGAALAYLACSLFGAGPRLRAAVLAGASAVLVVAPSLAFTAVGLRTDRPYGQDGGVVQLPLALDKILNGESPYGADYSDSILGRQARASTFWEPFGGNPILHHHAYLPGTHAVMMPFYLASKALGGAFDPRFVTLLAYAFTILLATRVVEEPSRKLAAAGVAALNPLVYWHQIFGANDIMFVAFLLLALWAGERGRPLLAGFALGLACATKQLAWPFAPFFLVHLSGAAAWSELVGRAAWRRLLGPLGTALGTFVAIVAPLAWLDLGAFYGDIVVYNVGLQGADNYPLGGTPGFGFANVLIYAGRVASLREYFPFGVFYALLVPLGLLLVHAQLRDRGPGRVLLNGSVALLASLYFSRIVHPNYLIPLAILLPLAVLVRGRSGDGAVVPLALLAVAVEVVENEMFRPTWDQAVAAGLPRTLTGVAALVAPRAGPGLTADPVGTGLSALVAGLALAYLVAFALGVPARVRFGLGVVAVTLAALVPTALLAGPLGRTGIRGQDPWVVQAPADTARLLAGRSPYEPPPADRPLGREAWSTSFRLEPPRTLSPDRPGIPPGAAALLAIEKPLLGDDPRRLTALALVLAVVLIWLGLGDEQKPLALGALCLVPPAALGAAFGGPAVLASFLLAGGALAAACGWRGTAGGLVGVAMAVDVRALLAAPFLLRRPGEGRGFDRRSVSTALVAVAALCALPVLLDVRAFLDALLRAPQLSPGFGLFNFVLYRGNENDAWIRALLAGLPLLAALLVGVFMRGLPPDVPASAGAALTILAVLFLESGVPADAVALPLALLAYSACCSERRAPPRTA